MAEILQPDTAFDLATNDPDVVQNQEHSGEEPANEQANQAPPEPEIPDEPPAPLVVTDEEFQDALATLMGRENSHNRPLFDHITAIIRHIFYNQDKSDLWDNRLDILSRLVKRHNVPPVAIHALKPGTMNATEFVDHQKVRDFFHTFDEDDAKRGDHGMHQGIGYNPPEHPLESFPPVEDLGDEEMEGLERPAPYKPIDLYEWLFYQQEAGLGFSETEMYLAMTAVLRFQKRYYADLQKMRFWGRIQAAQRPYYIIECEFKENSEKWYEKPAVLEAHPELANPKVTIYNPFGTYGVREDDAEDNFFTLDREAHPVPSPPLVDPDQKFKEVLVEESGNGANMFCYYVCQDLITSEWLRLPDVTPEQIRKARFLKRGFTGNLEAPVVACPVFPGNEQNYLRAQIARIAHSTTIGPIGQYIPPEDEEEPEEGQSSKFKLTEDPEFEHPRLNEILTKNLSGYGHNLPYILRQGRCSFWDPSPGVKPKGDDEEEEEEEEPEEAEEEEPEEGAEPQEEKLKKKKKLRAKVETGRPAFSPVNEDKEIAKDVPAWMVRPSCNTIPQNGVVKIWSLLWPGAMCIVQQNKSENFYVGDALKFGDFMPYMPPIPQPVFNQNMKMLQHAADATVEAEEEQRKKRDEAEKARLEALEEAAEEEQETEEGETEEGDEEEEEE